MTHPNKTVIRLATLTAVTTLSAALLWATSTDAWAQGGKGRLGMRAMGLGGGAERPFQEFDANGDGAVTQKEIDERRTQSFQQYDGNQDGTLSLDEFEPLWQEQARPRMVDRFQSFDDDGDGMVTSDEFDDPTDNLVTRFDQDDDGEISLDELPPRRGHGGRRGR